MEVDKLLKDGYVILPSVISNETCDKLKAYLDTKYNDDLPYNYFKGHYQINLPNNANDFPEEIVFNKKIHNIIKQIFGKSYYMYSYTCNANIAKQDQPYHMDCTHLHPLEIIKKCGSPGPPIQLICNIYLQDTNEDNGSFDIVPGSHLFTDFEMGEDGEINSKYIKNNFRCNLPKGSVIIRDKRTWHRGTKNNTDTIRYMVGTSYTFNWYKLKDLYFDKDCEDILYDAPFSTWNIKYK